MSAYTTLENFYKSRGDDKFVTIKELVWRIGSKSGPEYRIPAGWTFDVSVPKALQWLFSPSEPKFMKAAALHDHMLVYGWDRVTAGAVFHEALKADGVSVAKRLAMWLAVSLYKYF
jgi:hypothetical protein